jgi:hypothetical protein
MRKLASSTAMPCHHALAETLRSIGREVIGASSLEIEEGAADLRSVIGTGRAYRHRGAVPEVSAKT